jgi:hypothetical protein
VNVSLTGSTLAEVRRIAAMQPAAKVHSIALRALRLGLPLVERETREAALAALGLDREGL